MTAASTASRAEPTQLREHGIYTLEKPFDMADLTGLVDRALREAAGRPRVSAEA